MKLSSELINLIICPISGEKLEYDSTRQVLISKKAGLEYPVTNGIPLLLESESKKI